MFDAIIESAMSALSKAWLGTAITIIGVAFSWWCYKKTANRKRLSVGFGGEQLLGLTKSGLPAGLTVQYAGRNIPRLTSSVTVIWNSGDQTLRGSEIHPEDPLCLSLEGDGEIISVDIVKHTRTINQIAVNSLPNAPSKATVNFGFLDQGDGAVLHILHTSDKTKITISGTILGMPKGASQEQILDKSLMLALKSSYDERAKKEVLVSQILYSVNLVAYILSTVTCLIVLSFFLGFYEIPSVTKEGSDLILFTAMVGIVTGLVSIGGFITSSQRLRIPAALRR
jgi:hypothetical protein